MAVTPLRRVVVRTTVGSLALAALMGITALLVPGRFGSVQQRVLLTTLVVGAASVLTLCYLAIADQRSRWLGALGELAAVLAATTALVMFWAHWQQDPGKLLVRTFGVSGIAALTLAQFSLLLALHERAGAPPASARIRPATLVAGTVLAGQLIAVVLGWRPGDTAVRVVGVIAILDVLGTLVTIALGLFGGARREPGASLTLVVPAPLADRLRARAALERTDPRDLALEVVARFLRAGSQAEGHPGPGRPALIPSGLAPDAGGTSHGTTRNGGAGDEPS